MPARRIVPAIVAISLMPVLAIAAAAGAAIGAPATIAC